MRSFYTDQVTRHRAPQTDSIHGNSRDWTKAAAAVIKACRVQPMPETAALMEPDDMTGAVNLWRLMGPYGIDVENNDRIEWTDPAGKLRRFEVIGDPQNFRSPSGSVNHSETTLRSISG